MKVLVFAPHNDDEVLGVGGSIKRHTNMGDEVFVCEVTSGTKYKEMQAEAKKAHAVLGVKESFFLNLPVTRLKEIAAGEINGALLAVIKKFQPEIVYIPFIGDMHIDHRVVTESVMVAVRPIDGCPVKEIYMYETLSETGWDIPVSGRVFAPDVWVDISETIQDKLRAMECYRSQLKQYPHPRSIESIEALAKFRGATVGVDYAESFMLVRKIIC